MVMRLGDIRFLNSWPVTYALGQGRVPAGDLKLVSGSPAILNRRLLMGELDASAVSSILYLRHQEEWVPVPGLCIRSEGAVASVLVVSREPLEKLQGGKIGISNQGATTPVLLVMLLRRSQLRFSLEVTPLRFPEILEAYPAALLIGDEALEAAQSGVPFFTWDLAQEWAEWTKQPCVFALWVIRRRLLEKTPELLNRLQEVLLASYAWGRTHEDALVAAMRRLFPWEATFLRAYLAKLSYELDEKAWEGLKRLAREAEKIGQVPPGTGRKLSRVSKGEQGLARVSSTGAVLVS